jgi:beta-phosphoglucomutase-like phosphatase (HAD superfamily)
MRRPRGDSQANLLRVSAEATCTQCDLHTIPADIEAVVFDFDGTLADTTRGHERALRAALRQFDVELDAAWYRQHVGLSIHDLLAELPAARGLPHDEIVRQSRAKLLAKLVTVTPIDCVVTLLRAARHAELPCAVASGASGSLVRPGLAALELTDEFSAIVAREDAARGKPAPDLYAEAARLLNVPAERCLAVDDAPDGVASARTAGMNALTVVDGHLASADTTAANPERLGAGHTPHATCLPPARSSAM